MTFAAMAAWQAWLVLALVLAAAIAVFLIKIRPPQILVPSLTLWSRVLDEQRDRTLWERIRKAVSLAIAVLITLAVAMAILRPQVGAPSSARNGAAAGTVAARAATSGLANRTSIVIDSSWSMLAQTSAGSTRWDRAIARARALAEAAGGEEVVLSTTSDGVVEGPTPDVALIEAALDRISPSGGDVGVWPRVEGARVTHFLTDGAVARPIDADVVIDSVFEAAANVAITAFDVRPSSTLDSAGQAFLEIANYAATPQDVRIQITRGTAQVLDVHETMAAGTAVARVVPLARVGDARIRARVSARANALVIDDEAVAWIPGAQPVAVTVVSDQPSAFGVFLSKDPTVAATFVSSKGYVPGSEAVVIFDRTVPAKAPTVPALYIAPPAQPELTSKETRPGLVSQETSPGLVSQIEDSPQWAPGAWHPIVAGVDTQTMALDRARPYSGTGLVPIAVSATRTPLIYVRDEPDQRFALFTFSVTDSKLMFAPGFPVLLGNTIDWLAHPVMGGTRRPGRISFPRTPASITGPDNKPVSMTQIGELSTAMLSRPGFYEARSGGATSVIAVNTSDPDVSDLQRTRLPASATSDAGASSSRGRPWWLFATAAALLLIAAEWWTWQRRVTV
jgi:hypothetical protein